MKRQIKFRCWDGKSMKEDQESKYWLSQGFDEIEPNKWFMQFTGLFDNNEKEVYEGDIVKVLDRDWVDAEKDTKIYIVYWYKGGFMLVNSVGIEEKEKDNTNIYNKEWLETNIYRGYGRDKFEVIGNIYENPELLNN